MKSDITTILQSYGLVEIPESGKVEDAPSTYVDRGYSLKEVGLDTRVMSNRYTLSCILFEFEIGYVYLDSSVISDVVMPEFCQVMDSIINSDKFGGFDTRPIVTYLENNRVKFSTKFYFGHRGA